MKQNNVIYRQRAWTKQGSLYINHLMLKSSTLREPFFLLRSLFMYFVRF